MLRLLLCVLTLAALSALTTAAPVPPDKAWALIKDFD